MIKFSTVEEAIKAIAEGKINMYPNLLLNNRFPFICSFYLLNNYVI